MTHKRQDLSKPMSFLGSQIGEPNTKASAYIVWRTSRCGVLFTAFLFILSSTERTTKVRTIAQLYQPFVAT